MSWIDEYVLPAVLPELERLKADPKVINMVREALGVPRYQLEAEAAAATSTEATPAHTEAFGE